MRGSQKLRITRRPSLLALTAKRAVSLRFGGQRHRQVPHHRHSAPRCGRYNHGNNPLIASTVRSTNICPPSGPTTVLSITALYPPPDIALAVAR